MKKLLTLFCLLIVAFINAQDLPTIKLMAKSNSLEEIKKVSDKIANSASEKYVYFKTGNRTLRDEKYKVVIYTPATMTEEQKEELSQEEKDKCLLVVWSDYGGTYSFFEVYSEDKNIIPFWETTFVQDFDYRVTKDLKYKLVKNEKKYSIVKSY
ncbi:hypothetical protein [Flavobacterium praedii]|uniref:hypothetical protein n=1 Tax=Flavobacterium praedii TaxID=3002900 RepID=UPI002481EC8D|nr:hypothetical protein [Flavobacterium praedii]